MSRNSSVRVPKTEFEFNEFLAEKLRKIFPYVQVEEPIKMPNSVTFRADILARSGNNRLIVFETKFLPLGRALPYSTSLSVTSLKESLTHLMPDLPPIVILVTNAHVEDSLREVFGKAGIPVVMLSGNVDLFESQLRDALQQFAIDLPEFMPDAVIPEPTNQFCFVAFPRELKDVYSIAVEPAVHRAGLAPVTHTQLFDMKAVFERIMLSQIFVADITGLNPNVLIELGCAAGAQKTTLLLTQRVEEVPFDLRSFRVLPYKYTPDGLATLSPRLAETLAAAQRQSVEVNKGIRISDLLRNSGTLRSDKLGEPNAQDSLFFKIVLFLLGTNSGRNYLSVLEQFYETLDVAVPVLIRSKTFDDLIESATGAKPEIKDLPRRAPQDLAPYNSYTSAIADAYVSDEVGNFMIYATYLKDRRLVMNKAAYHVFNLLHGALRTFIENPG